MIFDLPFPVELEPCHHYLSQLTRHADPRSGAHHSAVRATWSSPLCCSNGGETMAAWPPVHGWVAPALSLAAGASTVLRIVYAAGAETPPAARPKQTETAPF